MTNKTVNKVNRPPQAIQIQPHHHRGKERKKDKYPIYRKEDSKPISFLEFHLCSR